MNGKVVAQGSQFSLNDVEVVSATIDIEDVRSHRTGRSRSMQAAGAERYHRIEIPMSLSGGYLDEQGDVRVACAIETRFHTPEEEIASVLCSGIRRI